MATYTIRSDGVHAINIANIQAIAPSETNYSSTLPVCINSCGYNYYEPNSDRIMICRPEGRFDYQLIYIQEGKGTFTIHQKEMVLEKGSLILYKPGEPQHYGYDTSLRTRAYWIHFAGSDVEPLLRQNNLWNDSVYFPENLTDFSGIIMKIIRELQFHAYNYTLNCHAYFLELICSISRALNKQSPVISLQQDALIPALNLMHNNFHEDYDIRFLADLCDMSVSHFIRKFKSFTGLPPHQYMTMIRIAHAKTMLISYDCSVSEIAQELGYDNPLYFSRLFKKYTGSSPSDFKKHMT